MPSTDNLRIVNKARTESGCEVETDTTGSAGKSGSVLLISPLTVRCQAIYRQLRDEPWKARALKLKQAFGPGPLEHPPLERVGWGDKAQAHCPRLEGLVP
jgi:hypothetical protein